MDWRHRGTRRALLSIGTSIFRLFWLFPINFELQLSSVQDADKLDAMGAIGIARCSAYSVVINRPLVPAQAHDSESDQDSSIAHFHDKLLKLKGLLKTEAGRRLGDKRHAFMLDYLERVQEELNDLS